MVRSEPGVDAVFVNSWSLSDLDLDEAVKLRRKGARVMHRLNGIARLYGRDPADDDRAIMINRKIADVSVFQSEWSRARFLELRLAPSASVTIPNGVDPRFFHSRGRTFWNGRDRFRLVISNWSVNVRKGFPYYRQFDELLEEEPNVSIDLIGNAPDSMHFRNIRIHAPVASADLGELLRTYHGLLQFAEHDTCSNAVLEGISCGLPVLYLDSGGTKEIAGACGVAYTGDFLESVDLLQDQYDSLVAGIRDHPFTIEKAADAYLGALGR